MEGRNSASNTSNSVVCHNCDKDGHIARDCPKSKIKCYNCNELWHLEKYCRGAQESQMQSVWLVESHKYLNLILLRLTR